MPRIPLVTREVHGAIDIDRQVCVDLNQTLVVPLIPVVAAPRLVSDELELELFSLRQRNVLESSRLALGNRRAENSVELRRWNHELTSVALEPLAHRSCSRKHHAERIDDVLEVRFGMRWCDCVVQCLRFFVERELLTLKHRDSRGQRSELRLEIRVA